jgi:hypothetical protein
MGMAGTVDTLDVKSNGVLGEHMLDRKNRR